MAPARRQNGYFPGIGSAAGRLMSSTIDDARPECAALDAAADRPASEAHAEAAAEELWQVPPAQPARLIASIALLGCAAASYGYALVNFWSSPILGIHMAIPYPAYLL